jgi:hypothetical protein
MSCMNSISQFDTLDDGIIRQGLGVSALTWLIRYIIEIYIS